MTESRTASRNTVVYKRHLSPARQQLLALLQKMNFGRVEDLQVRAGEPVLDPPPRMVREHKFSSENGPRPELSCGDFILRDQHIELMRLLDDIVDGTIAALSCKHGLPFLAELSG